MVLCSDGERVDNSRCRSLSEVSTSLARYKAAQDEIKKCKEQVLTRFSLSTQAV